MSNIIIGFTVGVWDTLHNGHINFLNECKKQCDYLHVGIMTDYWVRVQKGHDRPYYSLNKRIVDLRLTNIPDNIVVLDTLDMSNYLQMADIWFKGPEQKNMKPLEYSKTIYINRTEGISTTDIIKKINNE